MKDKNSGRYVYTHVLRNTKQFAPIFRGNINLGTIIFATSQAKPRWKVAADICDMLFISKNEQVFVNVFNCWKQSIQK